MPAKEKKPRTPSKRALIVTELKTALKSHKKKVSQIQKDLRSFGVGRRRSKHATKA